MKIHGTAKGGALSKKDFGVAFGGGNGNGADFESDYSDAGDWTQVNASAGADVNVNDTISNHVANNNADADTNHEVYQDMGLTLDNELWYADFQWTLTDAGTINASTFPFIFADATGSIRGAPSPSIYALGVMTQGGQVKIYYQTIPTSPVESTAISVSEDTLYYLRLERTGTEAAKLSVSESEAGGTDISGSPVTLTIPSAIQDLDILHHGICGTIANDTSSWNGTNIKVYDGVNP